MNFSAPSFFENAQYPCYFLSTKGDFQQNAIALELSKLQEGAHPIHSILLSLQKSELSSPTSLLSPYGNTLSIYPSSEGLVAFENSDTFLPESVVSHEMRENLSNIFALLGIVARRSDNEDSLYFDGIQKNCYSMLRLANNLENINSYSLPYGSLQLIDFAGLTTSIFESVETVCTEKSIPLQSYISLTPLPIRASKRLLTDAILNILRNSLQYTKDGNSISMKLAENNGKAVLTIRDHGMGIQPQYLSEIFSPYFSVDPYGDGSPSPGAGLGLAVAHHAAKNFCGTITAESVYGKGTRIVLSFPIDYSSDEVLGSEPADYLLDRYSPIYTQLNGYCRYPEL